MKSFILSFNLKDPVRGTNKGRNMSLAFLALGRHCMFRKNTFNYLYVLLDYIIPHSNLKKLLNRNYFYIKYSVTLFCTFLKNTKL